MLIETPTALLNTAIVKQNIATMARKAQRNGVRFRPHFKTHQSATLGEWFRAEGITALTASSVSMARYFADHGWHDITVAFPVNWREIDAINTLAARITLNLLVKSVETVQFLAAHVTHNVQLWIEVDAGYHRTGVAWHDSERLRTLVALIGDSERLTLRGLLTHAGNSYAARSTESIQTVYDTTVERLHAARASMADDTLEISVGDTPTCSVVEDLSAVDEVRPGNLVFYDVMQVEIGACTESDIGMAVVCPVVAKYAADRRVVIYGGAVHLSKDHLLDEQDVPYYGRVALLTDEGWTASLPGCRVQSLSQEHGIITASDDLFEQVQVGDVVVVLPVHSCLTANLLRKYRTLAGEDIVCSSI